MTSRNPPNVRLLDPREPIYAERFGFRALWTEWSVDVRVLSGALGKAPHRAAFLILAQPPCTSAWAIPGNKRGYPGRAHNPNYHHEEDVVPALSAAHGGDRRLRRLPPSTSLALGQVHAVAS